MNTRVLVHNSIRADFVAQLAAAARAVVVGDPLAAATQMGPLYSATRPGSGWNATCSSVCKVVRSSKPVADAPSICGAGSFTSPRSLMR